MIKFLLEKEFKQILRNPFLPKLIFIFPLVVLLVFPWAADLEIHNINLSVVDNDQSAYSHQLVQKIASTGYFRIADVSPTYKDALESVEKGESDVILTIPSFFERDLAGKQAASVMIASDAVNGVKGGISSAYLAGIISDFSSLVRNRFVQLDKGIPPVPVIETVMRYEFNQHLNYKAFMVPALMVILLTVLCGFLPALNIVGEKEIGTMEQINVSPVSRFTFILAKLLPFWIIGAIALTIGFVIAWLVYGLVPVGSFPLIVFFAFLYILTISGIGIVVSNHSSTMQQALFVIFFFMLIFILMSGIFTSVSNMPEWGQWIAAFNPLKYFMEVMRSIFLKGSGFFDLAQQFWALMGFVVFFNVWAVISYRKSS